jgi:hypothetical protein
MLRATPLTLNFGGACTSVASNSAAAWSLTLEHRRRPKQSSIDRARRLRDGQGLRVLRHPNRLVQITEVATEIDLIRGPCVGIADLRQHQIQLL